jgi:hypothetical protein
MLTNAPVVNADGVLGRLDEREFRAFADRVNGALQETIRAGLFALEREVVFDVVHRFRDVAEFLADMKTWTGTSVPAALRRRLQRSRPPFDVQEATRLRRLRVL